MTIKTGAAARVIQPVIQGTVKARRINTETDQVELLLEWQDEGADHTTQRWYAEDQLEAVTP